MARGTEAWTSLRDSSDVISEATRQLAELAAPERTRAAYLRVSDGVVTEEMVTGEWESAPTSYLLRDDPYVGEVVDSGAPLLAGLDRTAMGPTLRYVTEESGATHAAFVPVRLDGVLHGILRLEARATPISEDLFARCRALGDVVALALGNAVAHEEFEQRANSDGLTGLANRRGLARYLDAEYGRDDLGILVLEVDGLEAINDAHGREIGDRMIVAVAESVARTLRNGDLLARTGGGELVAVVTHADAVDARRVAERVTAALCDLDVEGVPAPVSVGYASCGKHGDLERARRLADESMHEAKRASRAARGHGPRTVVGLVPGSDGCRAVAAAPDTVVLGELPEVSL